MNEKEIIEQLQSELLGQIEDKVKVTRWCQLLFSDIMEELDEHFIPPQDYTIE